MAAAGDDVDRNQSGNLRGNPANGRVAKPELPVGVVAPRIDRAVVEARNTVRHTGRHCAYTGDRCD